MKPVYASARRADLKRSRVVFAEGDKAREATEAGATLSGPWGDWRDVRLALTSPIAGVVVKPALLQIGDLPPLSEGAEHRVQVTIPRTLGRDEVLQRLSLSVNVTQADFAAGRQMVALPFNAERPQLVAAVASQAPAIEGKPTQFVLDIANDGALPAEDVRVEISSDNPDVELLDSSGMPVRAMALMRAFISASGRNGDLPKSSRIARIASISCRVVSEGADCNARVTDGQHGRAAGVSEEELGRRLVSIGQVLSSRMSEGIDASQIARLDKTKQRVLSRLRADLQQAKAATGVRRIYLFDRSHDLIVDTAADHVFGQRAYELEIHNVEIERVFEHGTPAASVLFEGPDGLLYKTGFVPVTDEGVPIAALGVEADADYFELLTNFASVLTVLALLSVFLVILAGTVLGRRLVEPINRLVIAAERLGGGQLEEPVQGTGGADEIAFLGQAFEEMRQRLVSRDRQLQMMLSGIAHEVRNPLGGMELFCGLLTEDLRQLDLGGDEAHMLEKVARIQRELDYLEAVVTDFLDFARKAAPDRERFRADTFMADIDLTSVTDAIGVQICDLPITPEKVLRALESKEAA